MSLDQPIDVDAIHALADAGPPPSVLKFVQSWHLTPHDPWLAVTESALLAHPATLGDVDSSGLFELLRETVQRVEHVAVAWAESRTPPQWVYLLQSRKEEGDTARHVLLYPPASDEDLRQAENVLNMPLPPSYRRLLTVTNGVGLGARECDYVCGAGPARAKWNPVLLNLWMECGYQHEIAAFWREFQGTYAYERVMDRERGEDTFRSDETLLVPFAYTYETWCFDRTRADPHGEYPVVLWDHEDWRALDYYTNFTSWLRDELFK